MRASWPHILTMGVRSVISSLCDFFAYGLMDAANGLTHTVCGWVVFVVFVELLCGKL